MDGLIINVFRANGSDCTNGGISAENDSLLLVGAGVPEIFHPSPDMPTVTLVTRIFGGEPVRSLVPCDDNAKPLKGWYMFGGNFGYTSDSRFSELTGIYGAIAIHDRQEQNA